jgi:undecaprenyl-phosphate galactose phosphotransferase
MLARSLDIILIIIALPIVFVICLALFILVYLDSGRPVIFRQQRYGMHGKTFTMYKFRTMHSSDELLDQELQENKTRLEEYRTYRKLDQDPRVTVLGRTLRKFSLDEIPQVINILIGDMSFIGPRPFMTDELDLSDPDDMKVLETRPGVTGWWQVNGRNATTFEGRKELDRYYIDNRSIWTHIIILVKTPFVVLAGSGK